MLSFFRWCQFSLTLRLHRRSQGALAAIAPSPKSPRLTGHLPTQDTFLGSQCIQNANFAGGANSASPDPLAGGESPRTPPRSRPSASNFGRLGLKSAPPKIDSWLRLCLFARRYLISCNSLHVESRIIQTQAVLSPTIFGLEGRHSATDQLSAAVLQPSSWISLLRLL